MAKQDTPAPAYGPIRILASGLQVYPGDLGSERARSMLNIPQQASSPQPGVRSERDPPFLPEQESLPTFSLSCLKSLLGCHNFGSTVQTLQGGPEAFAKEALLATCIRTGTCPQQPSLQPHYTTLRFPKQTALVPPCLCTGSALPRGGHHPAGTLSDTHQPSRVR